MNGAPDETIDEALDKQQKSLEKNDIYRIGIISDTHGHLPQAAVEILLGNYSEKQVYERKAFKSENTGMLSKKEIKSQIKDMKPELCDLIIHAGDIISQATLDELEAYAPVVAVNGNCDYQGFFTQRGWTRDFESFTFHGVDIAVLHKPSDLRSAVSGSPWQPAFIKSAQLRIHGHTHEPHITPKEDYITLCPGSPTRPREGTRRSVAIVYIQNEHLLAAELIALA